MARARKGKGNVIKVDFTGVQAGPKILPEDDYPIKIADVSKETSDDSGKDYLKWEFRVASGKHEGVPLYYNTSLQPQALWNLRSVLEAFEINVPDGVLELNLDELKDTDTVAMASVEDDTYEGRKRSRIVDVFAGDGSEAGGGKSSKDKGDDLPEDDDIDEMDEDDLDQVVSEYDLEIDKKARKKVKTYREAVKEALEEKRGESGDSDDDGDDKPDEDAINEMDEDELEAVIKKHDLEVDLDDYKKLKAKRAAVIEALEAEGDGDDEKVAKGDVEEMDEDELEKVNENHDLGVDLDKHKKIKDKRKAILKALEKADKLEDDD